MSSFALRHRDVTPGTDAPLPGGTPGRQNDGTPAVDLVHLARQTGGDRELEAELLVLFVHQARASLGLLDAASRGRGQPSSTVAVALHTLCGSARAVGCWRVGAEAEALERTARAVAGPGGALLAGAVASLAAAVNRAVSEIEHVLGEEAASGG